MHEKQVSGNPGVNHKALARTISLVENKAPGYYEILTRLPPSPAKLIGITGAPGAGKSTLTDALIEQIVSKGKTVAVVCVDPTSPFNFGALLGDRIRMRDWYRHPGVYIRSLASRGNLGGLNPNILEITDVIKAEGFDYIIVETVGVGQSEVEIAGLADLTIVVLVPESGDDIQAMKAGLMEVADIFVVNKSDRPGADIFVKNLSAMLSMSARHHGKDIPVLQTSALHKSGTPELLETLDTMLASLRAPDKKYRLLAERAYYFIQREKMAAISKERLYEDLKAAAPDNVYAFIKTYLHGL